MHNRHQKELLEARCALPFDLLGVKETSGERHIICWFPNADRVEVLPWAAETELESTELESTEMKSIEMKQVQDAGLFELVLPMSHEFFTATRYCRFRVTYGDQSFEKLDPYQFSDITFRDFHHDAATLYQNQGAHLCSQEIDGRWVSGVRFAVFAPHARSVSVVGDFNHWDGRVHPMGASGDGLWRLFIPDVYSGHRYKFEIRSPQGDLLPHKVDPMAFSIDQHPSFASVVYDHQDYKWQDRAWQEQAPSSPLNKPLNIYEVHLGSWRFRDGHPLSYRELAEELVPYVKDMGYTHLELMPVSEYPYGGSWGYQPVGLFAPTSRYGTPDDFKFFVDACHHAGIGVILDWVPAHFPTDSHGLSNFDGTPLYEYPDPRKGWHQEWNSLIYDYGREHVCQFLISNALYWFDCFHIDGIRVDAVASMLYLDYARKDGEWVANQFGGNHNLEAVAFIKRLNETIYLNYPKAMTIAEESTSYPGVSKPTFEGGLGFGFKWNMGWMNDSLRYMSRDHIYRKYHHNELTFGMMYAFSEHFVLPLSHDEVVHGKRSLLRKMPGDEWQQFANLRAFSAYQYAHPGKKLNFMGSELAQSNEWDFNRPLSWELLEHQFHQGQQKVIRDLNHLYLNEASLYERDYHPDGFRWLAPDDSGNSILSMIRFAEDASDHLVIVINMTPVTKEYYAIGVPEDCHYKVVLNTDSVYYGGSNYSVGDNFPPQEKPLHKQPFSIALDIPPLAAVFLKPERDQ